MTGHAGTRTAVGRGATARRLAAILVAAYAALALAPLAWALAGSLGLADFAASMAAGAVPAPDVAAYGRLFSGGDGFHWPLIASAAIALASAVLAVAVATLAAYALSRLTLPLGGGLLALFLSTRLLPPVALAIPLALAYDSLGLAGGHLGLVAAHAALNLSLAVWLLKSYIDEVPRDAEEAALVEGYSRYQAFRRAVLPQIRTGLWVTAAFCFVFSWNEYALARFLAGDPALTAPVSLAPLFAAGGPATADALAAALTLLAPVVVLVILARRHLARGLSFGAARR